MDKEIKDEWVAALRSGEYKQGQKVLCSREPDGTEHHCCAGVLCEVLVKRGLLRKVYDDDQYDYAQIVTYTDGVRLSESYSLGVTIRKMVDLDVPQVVDSDGVTQTIYALNDTYKVPFDKIADLIEAQL